jgi:putative ABC transport system substrate-binding protein
MLAKAATTTIPIVFVGGGVGRGLVASLNRPGANVTGFSTFTGELTPKQLQLLHELIPNAARFGVLADRANPGAQSVITTLQVAARKLGVQLVVENARTDSDLGPAFATFSEQRVGGVLVLLPPQLAALAAAMRCLRSA